MTQLHKKIKIAAVAQGITITDLANKIGVSRNHLLEMLRGTRRFRPIYRERIATELCVTLKWIEEQEAAI